MKEQQQENSAYMEWLERRELLRGDMYGEWGVERTDHSSSLGALALATDLRFGSMDRSVEDDMSRNVFAVMESHNEIALQGNEGIYAFCDSEAMARVSKLAAKVILYWECASNRRGQSSVYKELFSESFDTSDFGEVVNQSVVELGSAILEITQYGVTPVGEGVSERNYLASFIARHGPEYARRWMQKSVITDYCQVEGIECENALLHMTPGQLKRIAIASSRCPEKRAGQIITWFNELTPGAIAAHTDWTEDEVSTLFSPARLMRMCFTGSASPLEKIQKMVRRVDTEFTSHLIAQRLGWEDGRAEALFGRKFVLTLALRYPNPTGKIEQIAHLLDHDLSVQSLAERFDMPPQEIDTLFTPRALRDIALGFTDPIKKIEQVVQDYSDVFSIENIANRLGISKGQAESIFSMTLRVDLATKYRSRKGSDAYRRPREILQTIRSLRDEYEIPERLAVTLARYHTPGTAYKKAEIILSEIERKPSRASDLMWMTVVSELPYGTHEQRLERLEKVYNWFNIVDVDAVADPQNDWRFDRYAREHALIPSPIDMNPSRPLVDLGQRAGVSPDDIKQLLLFFGNSSLCEIDDTRANELVAQLQAVSE